MMLQNEHHYLPVDDSAVEWGFYLTTVGRVLHPVSPDMTYGVHPDMYQFDHSPVSKQSVGTKSPRESGRVLPEFAVVHVTDTHAVFESDETGIVEFKEPSLLFLFPGVWHRYRPVGMKKPWMTSRWFGFNGDMAYRLMERQSIRPETAVRPAASPLTDDFDRLIERVAANPAADATLLSTHAMALLAACMEAVQDETGGTADRMLSQENDALVAEVLHLIWTGSHRGLTIAQLCDAAGANRRTVERRFTAVRGHSLLTEINRCRCQRARHFLTMTTLPLKNICWLAGFHNPKHMRETFRQITGMSPSTYRQRHTQGPQ